jgi:hypothetical protein
LLEAFEEMAWPISGVELFVINNLPQMVDLIRYLEKLGRLLEVENRLIGKTKIVPPSDISPDFNPSVDRLRG